MEENFVDESFIKEFGVERTQEINEAFSKAQYITDETALTIIRFLVDQSSLIIKEFNKIENRSIIINFFYYLTLGFSFYFIQTFKPIYILVLVSPQIFPILQKLYDHIKK